MIKVWKSKENVENIREVMKKRDNGVPVTDEEVDKLMESIMFFKEKYLHLYHETKNSQSKESVPMDENYVIVRYDNHNFLMNIDEKSWSHHIATAKVYGSMNEALDKVDELEANTNLRVYASPLSKEYRWYEDTHR